jgi:hypothetical protein
MDKVYLAWTIENWITVVLMAALGYLLLAMLWQAYNKYSGAPAQ